MTETEWLSSSDPASLLRWLTGTPGSSPEGASGVLAPARRPSDRKLRLFACACRRQMPDLRWDGQSQGWADMEDRPEDPVLANGIGPHTIPALEHAELFVSPRLSPEHKPKPDVAAAILRDIIGDPFGPVTLPSARTLCPDCPSGAPEEDCDDCAGDGFVWADAARDNCCRRCYGYGTVVSGAGGQSVGMEPRKTCPACRGHGLQRHPWITPEVLSLATAAYGQRDEDGTLDNAHLAVLSDALEEAGCDHAGLLSHLRSPGPHYRGMWSLDLVLGKE